MKKELFTEDMDKGLRIVSGKALTKGSVAYNERQEVLAVNKAVRENLATEKDLAPLKNKAFASLSSLRKAA